MKQFISLSLIISLIFIVLPLNLDISANTDATCGIDYYEDFNDGTSELSVFSGDNKEFINNQLKINSISGSMGTSIITDNFSLNEEIKTEATLKNLNLDAVDGYPFKTGVALYNPTLFMTTAGIEYIDESTSNLYFKGSTLDSSDLYENKIEFDSTDMNDIRFKVEKLDLSETEWEFKGYYDVGNGYELIGNYIIPKSPATDQVHGALSISKSETAGDYSASYDDFYLTCIDTDTSSTGITQPTPVCDQYYYEDFNDGSSELSVFSGGTIEYINDKLSISTDDRFGTSVITDSFSLNEEIKTEVTLKNINLGVSDSYPYNTGVSLYNPTLFFTNAGIEYIDENNTNIYFKGGNNVNPELYEKKIEFDSTDIFEIRFKVEKLEMSQTEWEFKGYYDVGNGYELIGSFSTEKTPATDQVYGSINVSKTEAGQNYSALYDDFHFTCIDTDTSGITITQPTPVKADFNKDRKTDIKDFAKFALNWKKENIDCSIDIAGDDCYLDIKDFAKFAIEYGKEY
jgi:hypothetical protein